MLINAVLDPKNYCVLGGTFATPVKEGLLDKDFVKKLRLESTFNDSSFDREYRSVWGGDSENAYFSSETFDKYRKLEQPEYENNLKNGGKGSYYVLGVDVGRTNCTTEICVFKVTPQPQSASLKSLVNVYTFDGEDFEEQAIKIKQIFYKFKARTAAIDSNGLT
nr:MAG TPA: terminase large subunit [Caudoviricetes sp.]